MYEKRINSVIIFWRENRDNLTTILCCFFEIFMTTEISVLLARTFVLLESWFYTFYTYSSVFLTCTPEKTRLFIQQLASLRVYRIGASFVWCDVHNHLARNLIDWAATHLLNFVYLVLLPGFRSTAEKIKLKN